MAANRYGRIYHSDHHYINLRFPSVDARREFADEFEKYHASHDHDGEAPRFEDTAASTIGSMEANTVHDAHSVSIDGYATYEIEAYHNPSRWNTHDRGRYRPPTCCVPPTLSINRTFIDSSTLTRHELSAIFMDMPEEDFQNLLKSVERDGFKDPVIRMIDEEVLDGWHRYRAAKELNLLRKLRFQQWDEKDEGDPAAFAYARNMGRRHQSKSLRAQIALDFHERFGYVFGHGGDRKSDESSGNDRRLKTQAEIAKEIGVGERTVRTAAQIKNMGRADEVLSGEKSAGEVITEETVKSLWEQINPAISTWKKDREGVGNASKSMFVKATLRWEGLPSDTKTDVKVLKELLNLLTTQETDILEELIRKQLDGKDLWGDASVGVETVEQETEQPTQTAEERKTNKLLKEKKQVIKSIWDKRIEAARDYTGDADSDLNLNLTLPELEKGFAKCEEHAYCADAFQSAIRRTSETSFNIYLEKTLASDVSLQALEAEYKALSTYALDLLQWKKQEWIEQLIDKKRKKAEAKAKAESEIVPDTEGLSEEFKRIFTLHSRFDRDIVDCEALGETYHLHVDDVESAMDDFQSELAALEHAVGKHLETDAELSAEEIVNRMDRIEMSDIEVVKTVMANVEAAAETNMNELWEAFNRRVPKWKAKYAESGYKENDLIQAATEAELFDALRVYRESDRTGEATAEEIQDLTDLMKSASYPYAHSLRNMLRDASKSEGETPDAEAEVEADTSLDDLNLPALKSFFDSLMYHVGPVENTAKRDNLSVAVWEVFYPNEGDAWDVTERDVLSILIDCAQSALTENE